MKRRALVLDGRGRPALVATRSLGEAGYTVGVGAIEPRALAFSSRHASATHVLPDPRKDPGGFARTVADLPYDVILPMTDWSILPLMELRHLFGGRVAMADNAAIQRTLNKADTLALAAEANVAVPTSAVVTTPGRSGLTLPIVVKTASSKGWTDGVAWDRAPRYAFTEAEERRHIAEFLEFGPVVCQEYVGGVGVGIGVLADRGRALVKFQYRRLHEVPVSGGGSSYRVSEALSDDASGIADRLAEALGWTGVMMVELKRTPDGALVLIEINGRFWGSLALPYHAGVPFAAWLADLHTTGRTDFPDRYRVGVRVRTLRSDVEWVKECVRKSGRPEVSQYPGLSTVLRDTARLLHPADKTDTLSFRDPIPGLLELGRVSLGEARQAVTRRRRRTIRREMETLAGSAALDAQVRRARSVMFICRGNIIRSAYAHARMAHLRPDVVVRSAGLWAHDGVQAHDRARARAQTDGFSLEAHRASPVRAEDVKASDLVFLMTTADLLWFRKHVAGGQGMLLGAMLPGAPELDDPVDGAADEFEAAFQRICQAADQLAAHLSSSVTR